MSETHGAAGFEPGCPASTYAYPPSATFSTVSFQRLSPSSPTNGPHVHDASSQLVAGNVVMYCTNRSVHTTPPLNVRARLRLMIAYSDWVAELSPSAPVATLSA